MAATHGSAAAVYINGYDTGAWANSVTFNMSREIYDSTVLSGNLGVKSHTANLNEATATISGFYDQDTVTDSNSGDYSIQAAYDGTVRTDLLYWPYGATTVGDSGFAFEGHESSYNIGTPVSGITTADLEIMSCTGKSNVKLLAALASRTNAFTGTSLDNSASSSNGGVGYLHLTSFTSGSVPVLIEHSTDNAVWSTLITFTAITAAHQSERIAVTGTVNRYLRASANGTYVGTFIVAFDRN